MKSWLEPWKKKELEPGRGRDKASSRTLKEAKALSHQPMMKEQEIQIVFRANPMFSIPGQFHNFEVHMSIPLTRAEIMQRMHEAFPALELKEAP